MARNGLRSYPLSARWLKILLVAIVSLSVTAHPLSVSYAIYHSDPAAGVLDAVYRLPMDDMDLLLQLDQDLDGIVSSDELDIAGTTIADYVFGRTGIRQDGVALSPTLLTITHWQDQDDFPYLELGARYPFEGSGGMLELKSHLLTDLYPDHRTLAEYDGIGGPQGFVFQNDNSWTLATEQPGVWSTIREYGLFGLQHILAGYDHILFLLGLLLGGRGLRQLLIVVTAFTVAHSMTLALATLGLVRPLPGVVESLVALSIAWVGIENIVRGRGSHRWLLAFIFGMVHGFGFAGALTGLTAGADGMVVALISFNMGVEAGQILVVLLAWPFLQQIDRSGYHRQIVRILSAVIAGFGLFWFIGSLL